MDLTLVLTVLCALILWEIVSRRRKILNAYSLCFGILMSPLLFVAITIVAAWVVQTGAVIVGV
jgi:hypothetical protein